MRTLQDIEKRSEAINNRLMSVFDEIRKARGDGEKTSLLAEELGRLLHEARVIQHSLKIFQETAKMLLSEECHGPH